MTSNSVHSLVTALLLNGSTSYANTLESEVQLEFSINPKAQKMLPMNTRQRQLSRRSSQVFRTATKHTSTTVSTTTCAQLALKRCLLRKLTSIIVILAAKILKTGSSLLIRPRTSQLLLALGGKTSSKTWLRRIRSTWMWEIYTKEFRSRRMLNRTRKARIATAFWNSQHIVPSNSRNEQIFRNV